MNRNDAVVSPRVASHCLVGRASPVVGSSFPLMGTQLPSFHIFLHLADTFMCVEYIVLAPPARVGTGRAVGRWTGHEPREPTKENKMTYEKKTVELAWAEEDAQEDDWKTKPTTVGEEAQKRRVRTVVREVVRKHKVPLRKIMDMPVVWNHRLRTTYGRYKGKVEQIELAPWLHNDPRELKDTFLHEVAHAIKRLSGASGSSHGRAWREIAGQLGAKPKRRGDVDVKGMKPNRRRKEPVTRRTAVCESCGYEWYGTRALHKNSTYTCSRVDWEGLTCGGDVRKVKR
jgi:predicted SprT family Zn-dependent metalloprotease